MVQQIGAHEKATARRDWRQGVRADASPPAAPCARADAPAHARDGVEGRAVRSDARAASSAYAAAAKGMAADVQLTVHHRQADGGVDCGPGERGSGVHAGHIGPSLGDEGLVVVGLIVQHGFCRQGRSWAAASSRARPGRRARAAPSVCRPRPAVAKQVGRMAASNRMLHMARIRQKRGNEACGKGRGVVRTASLWLRQAACTTCQGRAGNRTLRRCRGAYRIGSVRRRVARQALASFSAAWRERDGHQADAGRASPPAPVQFREPVVPCRASDVAQRSGDALRGHAFITPDGLQAQRVASGFRATDTLDAEIRRIGTNPLKYELRAWT